MATTTPTPAKTLAEAAASLRRPFVPEAIEFLVIATYPKDNPSKGVVAPYLSAVSVEDRLDYAVGPDGWAVELRTLDNNTVACRLTVLGVSKESIGQGENRWSQEANAFKRAAKRFGVGRYLYKMTPAHVDIGNGGLKRSGRATIVPDQLAAQLRAGYAERVKRSYTAVYGELLDHNEVPGQLGDEGAPVGDRQADAPKPQAAPAPKAGLAAEGGGDQQPPDAEPPLQAVEPQGNPLATLIAAGGYKPETVGALADFVFGGQQKLDQLAPEQVTVLKDVLESAISGAIDQPKLAQALARAIALGDREQGVKRLCAWIAEKAAEMRAGGRQAAAA